jgi:AraC family transcriptional regulator
MNSITLSPPIRSAAPPEFQLDQLLCGPSRCSIASRSLHWRDYLVEEHSVDAGEREESIASYALLVMWRGARGSGEVKVDGGRFMPHIKHPGFFSLCPAGQRPAARNFTRSHVLVFAIQRSFMETLELEMDRRPTEKMRVRIGFQDPGLRQLMSLLSTEAKSGGVFGRIYADSLAQAVAARLLYFNEGNYVASRCDETPLPRHLLRRVVERMRNLNTDLDLRTLAAETGYSQRHFIRMFRAATGQTPHRFLVQLRLEHATRLLQRRASLIDVAAASGFSSHAHMTQVFRRVLGVTPSEFRKGAVTS